MQKILFGVFAHPDDEAFGPAATLVKEVAGGTELHLICLTAGENGTNPNNAPDLGVVRLGEWRAAGQLIGASSMTHLGYIDGTLNNSVHREITTKIMDIVREKTNGRDDIEIELMSLDLNGFTGHIDHIVAARSICLAFYRLRDEGLPMRRVRLFCFSESERPTTDTKFVYMEPGHTAAEIGETVDARDYREQVDEIMRCHETQRHDYEWVKSIRAQNLAIDNFIVKD
ncbi:MAG: LmbE family protein [Candidatus Saccharibacteria bacterium]|nr:LmbE family protein [Candidatus Saccharibacteria bacterium]